MSGRSRYLMRRFMVGLVALSFAGCGDDASAPAPPPITTDGQFHAVRLVGSSGSPAQFAVHRGPGRASVSGVQASPAASDTSLSFWAYTDRDAGISIDQLLADGTTQPYLSLSIPHGSLFRRPGGSQFAAHDSILITVLPNSAELRADLEPTGLQFNLLIPSHLTMSYQGADPDFNGDGLVNFIDDYIVQVLLGLRTRQSPASPWLPLPSINDLISKDLSANLRHFTGYAVSW